MTLLDLIDGALHERGDAPAVNDVTYRALRLGSLRVARRLRERGLRAGDRLSLYCENRLAFVFAYLAALRSGIIAVPTNVLYRTVDLQHVLSDADARAVMVSEQTAPHVHHLADRGRELIDAHEVEAWARDEAIEPLTIEHRVQPADVAAIIYTSGTTGRSKGAQLTHDNFATIAAQLTTAWRWTAADRLLIALPLFHLHGLAAALNSTLAAGAHILIHERFDARTIMQTLREAGVTMFFGVPTMYVRLLALPDDGPAPRLRLFVSGSAALPADVHRAFEQRFGGVILERYGATEFGFPLTNRFGGPRVPGSVGIPMPGTAARIAAPPDGVEPLPPGEVGELLVSGPTVFAGYWNNPAATEAAFVTDGSGRRWYRSGDLARHDPNDDVYQIVGRIKELIISGGFNVYPREIETEIDRYPGVRASAVIGAPDPARGELPVAFIECEREVDAEALIAYLRENLASFKVPKAVRVIDALPRNALGKVEKQRLRELLVNEATAGAVPR
jgi:malonyl-CoA/methylmalonyl-CoA synthetase